MVTDTRARELLACPFCGSDEISLVEFSKTGPAFVECAGCAMQTPNASTADEAIAAWNTRTPSPDAEAMREAAAKCAERFPMRADYHTKHDLINGIAAVIRNLPLPTPSLDNARDVTPPL